MNKILLAAACVLAISTTGAMAGKRDRTASATSYPYCLKTSIGPGDCKYTTLQQCQATLAGIGGDCVRNYGPR